MYTQSNIDGRMKTKEMLLNRLKTPALRLLLQQHGINVPKRVSRARLLETAHEKVKLKQLLRGQTQTGGDVGNDEYEREVDSKLNYLEGVMLVIEQHDNIYIIQRRLDALKDTINTLSVNNSVLMRIRIQQRIDRQKERIDRQKERDDLEAIRLENELPDPPPSPSPPSPA